MTTITLAKVETALAYLAETDKEYARSKADIEYSKHLAKVAHAQAYEASRESTAAGKSASATLSGGYGDAMIRIRDCIYDYELIRAKRLRAELTIDVWRSVNSARNKGQIV